MLQSFRNASQSGIGRAIMTVILGLLIVAFAVWGIGDVFRGFTSNKIASVGEASITAEQFHSRFQNALLDIQQKNRMNFTADMARAAGLDKMLLQTMLSDAALDARGRTMGLAVSDAAIAESVRNDPEFKGPTGEFSKVAFDAATHGLGLSEAGYVAQQRSAIRRRQLELAVSENVAAPKLLVAALADVERETRAIDYFVLPKDAGPEPAAPSPEMLKAYFEDRKSAFAAPEIRSFRYVLATPASLAKPDEVSDEDARPVYDQQKEKRFFQPERRKLQQMVFDKEADAADALAKLKAGASFEDVAKEKGKTDIDLGEQTQAEIFDKDLAVAAFALAQGAYGDVVKGQFGYVIPRVLAITPAQTIPFEEIGVIIKSEIARDRAAKQIQGLHDKFEDAKTNGKTLEEAAKSLGLEVRLVAGVDHGGLDAAGAKVELPDAATLLSAVFGSDIGVDNDSLRTKDRGYIWFDVTKVDAAHERGFDEVKELVEKRRRTDEADKALVEKASDLVKRLREGATVAALAEELKLAVKQAKDLRRDTRGDLGEAAVVAIFAGPANDSGSAATPEGRLIFKVTADVTPPVDPADEAIKTLVEKTGNMLAADLVQQYIAGIKRELGVKIDAAAVKAAQGG